MVMVTRMRGAAAIAGATAGVPVVAPRAAVGRRQAPRARTRPAMPSGLSTAVATSSRPDTEEVVLAKIEGAIQHDVADAQRDEAARQALRPHW